MINFLLFLPVKIIRFIFSIFRYIYIIFLGILVVVLLFAIPLDIMGIIFFSLKTKGVIFNLFFAGAVIAPFIAYAISMFIISHIGRISRHSNVSVVSEERIRSTDVDDEDYYNNNKIFSSQYLINSQIPNTFEHLATYGEME
ncbi:MAG: hypothetical protein CO065_05490 [Comamonadaceae bacterium CG_4_9_14_0_8_um_filter_57_21]|nr:MAG: hypothetical protein CO065_05490 [Comamonadaceae bacterium CG_4_9_14_0_8_um_filter_57_21]